MLLGAPPLPYLNDGRSNVRRVAAAVTAIVAVALLVGVAPPAIAAVPDPIPAPNPRVNPVYDLPSTWPTLSEEEALLRKHEINLARDANNAKWWTRPVNLTTARGLLGAGGVAIGGLMIGYTVGQGGVAAVAAIQSATGTKPDWLCNTPTWYQDSGATMFVMGAADCPAYAPPERANDDQAVESALVYQGTTRAMYAGIGNYGAGCHYVSSAPLPTGVVIQAGSTWPSPGSWNQIGPTSQVPSTCGGTFSPPSGYGMAWTNAGAWTGAYRIYDSVAATVLATSTSQRANPLREARCVYHFEGGSLKASGWVSYTDEEGFPVKEWGEACDSIPMSESDILTLRSIGVEERTDGGAITEIADSEVPTEMQQYSENHGIGRKGLILTKTIEVGQEIDCLVSGTACADWWTETSEGTVPGTYRCLYGGNPVDLIECGVYRNSFQPGTQTPTITDPETGEQIEWDGSTDPTNSLNPGTGPGTSPGDQCMARWSAAPNPLEWVFWPVRCALVWAFVPRAEVVNAATAGLQTTVDGSVIGSVTGGLGVLAEAFDSGVGCGGLPFVVEFPGFTVSEMLLASCDEPMAGIAATVRTVLSVVVWFGAFLAGMRYLSALFGFVAFGNRDGVLGNGEGGGVSFR